MEPKLSLSGPLQVERQSDGAVLRFTCDPGSGTRLLGSPTLLCQGNSYNDSTPVCVSGPTQVTVSGPDTVQLGEEV